MLHTEIGDGSIDKPKTNGKDKDGKLIGIQKSKVIENSVIERNQFSQKLSTRPGGQAPGGGQRAGAGSTLTAVSEVTARPGFPTDSPQTGSRWQPT